jgi:hypothetical protein
MKVVKLKKPKGDPELIRVLVEALASARSGNLLAASVCIIANKGHRKIRLFYGSKADNVLDTLTLLGQIERAKHGLLEVLAQEDADRQEETGSFDPDPAA